MNGSKRSWKKYRFACRYENWASYWCKGNFNKKIRQLSNSVYMPDGGHFKKVDAHFEWGY